MFEERGRLRLSMGSTMHAAGACRPCAWSPRSGREMERGRAGGVEQGEEGKMGDTPAQGEERSTDGKLNCKQPCK